MFFKKNTKKSKQPLLPEQHKIDHRYDIFCELKGSVYTIRIKDFEHQTRTFRLTYYDDVILAGGIWGNEISFVKNIQRLQSDLYNEDKKLIKFFDPSSQGDIFVPNFNFHVIDITEIEKVAKEKMIIDISENDLKEIKTFEERELLKIISTNKRTT